MPSERSTMAARWLPRVTERRYEKLKAAAIENIKRVRLNNTRIEHLVGLDLILRRRGLREGRSARHQRDGADESNERGLQFVVEHLSPVPGWSSTIGRRVVARERLHPS